MLFEQLSREEWSDAARTAEELVSVANRIYVISRIKEFEHGNHPRG
jgi:hypothetical protein